MLEICEAQPARGVGRCRTMRGSATSTPIKVGRGWLMTRANTVRAETRPETMTLQNLDVSEDIGMVSFNQLLKPFGSIYFSL